MIKRAELQPGTARVSAPKVTLNEDAEPGDGRMLSVRFMAVLMIHYSYLLTPRERGWYDARADLSASTRRASLICANLELIVLLDHGSKIRETKY